MLDDLQVLREEVANSEWFWDKLNELSDRDKRAFGDLLREKLGWEFVVYANQTGIGYSQNDDKSTYEMIGQLRFFESFIFSTGASTEGGNDGN
jgi:hypothetical protein